MSEYSPEKKDQLLDEASRSTSGLPRDYDSRDEVLLSEEDERNNHAIGDQRRRDVIGSYTTPMPDEWFKEIED